MVSQALSKKRPQILCRQEPAIPLASHAAASVGNDHRHLHKIAIRQQRRTPR